jgi:hypothetical protein
MPDKYRGSYLKLGRTCLWTDINVNGGSLHHVPFELLHLEFSMSSPLILSELETHLKLFIYNTVKHLLHILLNLCLLNFLFIYLFIYFFFWTSSHREQGLDSTECWGPSHFSVGHEQPGLCEQEHCHGKSADFQFIISQNFFSRVFPIDAIAYLYTVKLLSFIPLCIIFPTIIHFFWSQKIVHTNSVLLCRVYCSLECHFCIVIVQILSPGPRYSQKDCFVEKNSEHYVMFWNVQWSCASTKCGMKVTWCFGAHGNADPPVLIITITGITVLAKWGHMSAKCGMLVEWQG